MRLTTATDADGIRRDQARDRTSERVVNVVPDDSDADRAPSRGELPARVSLRIELPNRTILRVLIALAALWFLFEVWTFLLDAFVGVLLAMAIRPLIGHRLIGRH